MASIGCLIKDTQIVADIKDILRTAAQLEIADGRSFSINKAYAMLRNEGVEVDLESVGSIYENTFDLRDGNFTEKARLDKIVGASFKSTLDNLVAMQPRDTNETTGDLSPSKQVAKNIATMFRNATVTDTHTQSLMLQFQKALQKAATRLVDKSGLPNAVKQQTSFEDILSNALDLEGHGFKTLQGSMNNLGHVWSEFKTEVNKYIGEMQANGADQATIDSFDAYTEKLITKSYELMLSAREAQDVVKGALIDAGFGRDVKQGNVTRAILDWKKLAGIGSDLNVMQKNVSDVLAKKGFSQSQIDRINGTLQDEYVRLRAQIIERATNNLQQRNELRSATPKSDASRLAELYSYGLFDAAPDTYDKLLNNVLGVADIDQQTFDGLKVYAKSLQTLYSTRFNEQSLNEEQLKTAINTIGVQIEKLLHQNRNQHSKLLRAATAIQTFFEAGQRMVLNSINNAWVQNPLSGYEAKVMTRTGYNKSSTAAMQAQQTKVAEATRKDITRNGGVGFGDVNSVFVNRGGFDHLVNTWINKVKDPTATKRLHNVMSVAVGRLGLDAMDSFYKVSLVEKKFSSALIKVLTDDTNPNKMTRADALSFVSARMTGQSFDDAKTVAKSVIQKINSEAGSKILSDGDYVATRMANDMVKANLVMGDKVTEDMIMAAYKSAYRASGRDLGHVPNNIVSQAVTGLSSKIETTIAQNVKEKQYTKAALLTLVSIFNRNMLNPFVSGGTNWIVLKIEKSGLGLATGLASQFYNRDNKLDLSTETGRKDMEHALYEDFKVKDKYLRGAIGGLATVAVSIIAASQLKPCHGAADATKQSAEAAKGEDCYGNWRKNNKWLSRYIDNFTPEPYLLALSIKSGELSRYIMNLFNRNDDFSSSTELMNGIQQYGTHSNQAMGLFGQAIGQKVNAPLPWRLGRDMWTLEQGFTNQYRKAHNQEELPMFKNDYSKAHGFMDGFFRGGLLELSGENPKGKYDLSDIPGAGDKTLQKLKEKGITDINDPRLGHAGSIRYHGKKVFNKENAKKIKDILDDQNE